MIMPFRPSLAGDKVMHVGDPVVLVVAETAAEECGTLQRFGCDDAEVGVFGSEEVTCCDGSGASGGADPGAEP